MRSRSKEGTFKLTGHELPPHLLKVNALFKERGWLLRVAVAFFIYGMLPILSFGKDENQLLSTNSFFFFNCATSYLLAVSVRSAQKVHRSAKILT